MSIPDSDVLEKAYADLVSERDRLRGARAGFTARLGPLPASAAIVIGLTGSAADKVDAWWLVEAAVLLAVLILISIAYSGLPPYRLLRAAHQRELDPWGDDSRADRLAFGVHAPDAGAWLKHKIELEERIVGRLREDQAFSLKRDVDNLQDALDVERWASVVVQILFAETVFVLVLGLAMHDVAFKIQAGIGAAIALVTLVGLRAAFRRSPPERAEGR